MVSVRRGHSQDMSSLNSLGTTVRDNILIHFLKLEIFLKEEGSQILQEIPSLFVYKAMAVICTIFLDQLSFEVYRMQVSKGRGVLSAAGLCV